MTTRRVQRDTRRAFYWLLAVSLLLHLVLTPFAGLLSFIDGWLTRDEVADETPAEQLKELPIELFEDEPEPEPKPDVLPEEDPVALIDKIVELPVEAQPAAQPATPKPEPAKPEPKSTPKPDGTKPAASTTSPEVDAGAPPPAAAPTTSAPAVPPAASSVTAPEPAPTAPSSESPSGPVTPPSADLDNPVTLAGKGGKIVEKQTSVGLILYMDRVRSHPLGKRIAALLPKLPQWDEFFGDSRVNPVQDFDRMFLLGPSFSDSSGLVMAIDYNTSQDKIRAAVNGLVKQRGSWLTGSKIPTALTWADRAERVILFPGPKTIMVVPPHLREQAQRQGVVGVPKAKGPEAMVAFTVNPAKVLRRFGVDIPATLQSATVRLTPLDDGGALLELEARDESEARAKETAQLLTTQINATVDALGSVSGIASMFGFRGLAEVATLPHVKLTADGNKVKGRQVLSQSQVTFILGQVERELMRWQARHAPAPSPAKTGHTPNPATPKPNQKH